MGLINFKHLRQLVLKIGLIIAAIYVVSVAIITTLAMYFFINLSGYQPWLKQIIVEKTGYQVQMGELISQFDKHWQPQIIIRDFSLINPRKPEQLVKLKSLSSTISYRSFWQLQPIFAKLDFDGIELKIKHNTDSTITINGFGVFNKQQTLANVKASSFDFEAWLLKQRIIKINHLNIEYLDLKNELPLMQLHNISAALETHSYNRHRASIDVFNKSEQPLLETTLNWQGGKLKEWLNWKSAQLSVHSLLNSSNLANEKVLSSTKTRQFNANTAFSANMQNGRLQNLSANFDVNNFKLALANADFANFPRLGGKVQILLHNNNYYTIDGSDLMISTGAGALFNNAQIKGHYLIEQNGELSLSNTNLIALNNFFSLFNATNGISLNGTIQQIKYNWFGRFEKPRDYQVVTTFNDISLLSKREDYPSISHVSGDLNFGPKAGKLNLQLQNSVLLYPKIFLIPYEFKTLQTAIEWKTDNKQILTVTAAKTPLETKDFKAWLDAVYTYNPNKPLSPSYLTMHAQAQRVLASKVGDYLPITGIPMSVHKWLNMGLAGGYGLNANMLLKGPLADFPFQDGGGIFYITADLDKAKLQFAKDWPSLDDIYGQFILNNTNITIKAKNAKVQGNSLDQALVVIPNYAESTGAILIADGKAHGSTTNFMTYLKNTPLNDILGKLPEKIVSIGDATLDLHLKVPLADPMHTEVKGRYHFIDNQLQFALPIPVLNTVNGDLDFTHKSLSINSLYSRAFATDLKLSANTLANGQFNFVIDAPLLDYQQVAKLYLPPFAGLISGNANTKINFQINKHGIDNLTANSNLQGVTIDAPAPIAKKVMATSSLQLNLKPSAQGVVINWNYANILHGQQLVNNKEASIRGQMALGNNVNYLDNPDSKIMSSLVINVPQVKLEEYLALVTKIVAQTKLEAQQKDQLPLMTELSEFRDNGLSTPRQTMPLQIQLKTPELLWGKANYHATTANIFVEKQRSYFNFYTPTISGVGNFNYKTYTLDLNLDKYSVLLKAKPKAESVNVALASESSNKTAMHIPNVNLTINNLLYQNHNLGKLTTRIFQVKNTLYIESGVLDSPTAKIQFKAANYCFACAKTQEYVDFNAQAQIVNAGDLLYNLDFGRILANGYGNVDLNLQWSGGIQDFSLLKSVGYLTGKVHGGKLLQVNPGLLGGLLGFLNLQGLFEFGFGTVADIFKKGFFFSDVDFDVAILTTRVELKKLWMSGPLASVNSKGVANFATHTLDAYVEATPKLGFAVALTAGVVTLNPIVGAVVYLGELLAGDVQNKLFTFSYHVSGDLHKPQVERVGVREQLVKNVNATVGN